MTVTTYRWVCRCVGEHTMAIVWAPTVEAVVETLGRRGLVAIQIIPSDPSGTDADYPEAL